MTTRRVLLLDGISVCLLALSLGSGSANIFLCNDGNVWNKQACDKVLRLRGGVMWVGGGKTFNRTHDPSASPEDVEDTFAPLRSRSESANRIKQLVQKYGSKYRTNEIVSLEEEAKYLIRAQKLLRVQSLSVEFSAASQFQSYVVGDLSFKSHRVGYMFGHVDKNRNVFCDVIYEPPQRGDEEAYNLTEVDPDEEKVERLASLLGMRMVGMVFSVKPRKSIFSSQDVMLACSLQHKMEKKHGYDFASSMVSAVITRNETTDSIVFEAYQISDLCLDMYRRDILVPPNNPNRGYTRTVQDVLVERKDTQKVDNDFFINTVPIKTHNSEIWGNREAFFPVKNRPGQDQNRMEVKHILLSHEEVPFCIRMRDFHMLLYLSNMLDPLTDLPIICKSVREDVELQQGHIELVKSIAYMK
mmetsp:Transcript_42331/g.133373  ORF Transcript_42331/g.133373 Transcript_42331/m.133373 type:complete len:414 (+) Transcript_42331:104-1345(+)